MVLETVCVVDLSKKSSNCNFRMSNAIIFLFFRLTYSLILYPPVFGTPTNSMNPFSFNSFRYRFIVDTPLLICAAISGAFFEGFNFRNRRTCSNSCLHLHLHPQFPDLLPHLLPHFFFAWVISGKVNPT